MKPGGVTLIHIFIEWSFPSSRDHSDCWIRCAKRFQRSAIDPDRSSRARSTRHARRYSPACSRRSAENVRLRCIGCTPAAAAC